MSDTENPSLITLLDLIRRAQKAASSEELAFMLVNETHLLLPYRQAALWFSDVGVHTLSGVVQLEANAPYVLWLKHVFDGLATGTMLPRTLNKKETSPLVAAEWDEWLPSDALWLPLLSKDGLLIGALLLVRDEPWTKEEIALVTEWLASWHHSWQSLFNEKPLSWQSIRQSFSLYITPKSGLIWWKQRRVYWSLLLFLSLFVPVRLSVLAPGELVPSNPVLIRAPLDGVIGQFSVKPNEVVKAGQLLFDFEDDTLLSRRDVALQALATAEAEYSEQAQQALLDSKVKAQLGLTAGRIAEKKAETEFVEGQVNRAHVLAPQEGVVLFDDPSEWIGKPVQTGERIMRIANPDEVEIEAWVAIGDAVPMVVGSPVSLYLNASPLSSVEARLRYMSHEAVQLPDGSYAYRVRAQLEKKSNNRVGLKGTARLSGDYVPLIYWIVRRPLYIIRQTIGW